MSETEYLLRGTASSPKNPTERDAQDWLGDVKRQYPDITQRTFVPGHARDGASDEMAVEAAEVVKATLENGFEMWIRSDDLFKEYGRQATARDGASVWELEPIPPNHRVPSDPSRESRGVLSVAIKTLDFFGFDVAEKTAATLSKTFEDRLFAKGGIDGAGLYRISLDDTPTLTSLTNNEPLASETAPLLVFIHGTASSAIQGFGKLWASDNSEGALTRARLRSIYGDRVFAYEHRTLTESPVQNAAHLASILPPNTSIHLVTHSRGGLVGELLCLGASNWNRIGGEDLPLDEMFSADRTMAPQLGLSNLATDELAARDAAYANDRKLIDQLVGKRLDVKRFVRVAAPARGTTLASGRLDRWLSVLNDLTSIALPSPLLDDSMDFLFAVVKERTDPRTLPGLEAMMPGSALTRLLNHPAINCPSDLTVIAGDIEGSGLWDRFKVMMTDWFYGAAHDLVVNTGSMFGGFKRGANQARFAQDEGPGVDHFHYFSNPRSVRWLLAGLTRKDDETGGFTSLTVAPQEAPKWRSMVARSRAPNEQRPLAVVIPGTMGSHLNVENEHIWLNYAALFGGGLSCLEWGEPGIEPVDLIDDFYGPLLEFLTHTHRVEVFPYDWRESVQVGAEKLALKLKDWLPRAENDGQSVHLLAHSMGGLVVRAMIADQALGADIWQRIKRLPNSRFLMLGTPNRGSYEAVRWLTGFNPTQSKLALLDAIHSTNDIIGIVQDYPGLLELLPNGDDRDFSTQNVWQQIKEKTKAAWDVSEAAKLRDIRATWELLDAHPGDTEFMRYVAGCQDATVVDYRIVQHDPPLLPPSWRLEFDGVREGDGTVTWASGRLPDVPMYYVESTAHDNLCAQTRAFVGYLDILTTGSTTRLPAAPPVTQRSATGTPLRFPMPSTTAADYIPSAEEVSRFNFGGARPLDLNAQLPYAPIIDVCVSHGDLTYARHPVLVGHYAGDTIVSAERVLDRQLSGALTTRLGLGIYPGRVGSHATFFNKDDGAKPSGAVVIGLGQVGEIAPSLLESGASAALIDFALQIAEWPDSRFGGNGAVRSAAVSCLLVGTGAAELAIRDSIESILRAALSANKRLVKADLNHKVVIDRIEFVELYEDIAISACDALRGALEDGPLGASVRWPDKTLRAGRAPRRRVRFDDAPEWWQRLEITEEHTNGHVLRFIYATDRARAEETLATGQLSLAESFIRQASESPSRNSDAARTLFEMLLPLRLREQAPKQQSLILQVDEYSARFPWELLENKWSHNGRPPAIQAGMLRQLKSSTFRDQPAHGDSLTALVVGNPDLDGSAEYPDLPGARTEAQHVAQVLRRHGYDVLDSIDEKKDNILFGLHHNPWRILHLAGHGVHEHLRSANAVFDNQRAVLDAQRVSGMVIGSHDYLTPGDVEQLRWVPELVFVNCCHLGKTLASKTLDRGALAANLGVEFIRMGARAVVVAGWAVDDAAAKTFADVFYDNMLGGRYFGDAVRMAREVTRGKHSAVNTWGAYQCYGDPNFSLTRQQSTVAKTIRSYSAPSELVVALENHTSSLRAGGNASARNAQRSIDAILKRIPMQRQDWQQRADVSAALGLAYGEAGLWQPAIEVLDRALGAEIGDLPVRVLEQRANYKVRLASEKFSALIDLDASADAIQAKQFIETVENAITELEQLIAIGATQERLNLAGSANKRLAKMLCAVGKVTSCNRALVAMRDHFRIALESSSAAGRYTSVYSYVNWASAVLLHKLRTGKRVDEHLVELQAVGADLIEDLIRSSEIDPNFWDSSGLGDIAVARLLASATSATQEELGALAEHASRAYRAAMRRGASPRQFASLREHLQFMIALLSTKKTARIERVVAQIQRVLATIKQ